MPFLTYLLILAGLVLLLVGGEFLVRGSVSVARRFGVSPLLIGIVLVGFGTSSPELITSIEAALRDAPGIAVGNVVGSNIANILLIVGVSALLLPLACPPSSFRRDGTALALATIACMAALYVGFLDRWLGAVFLAGLAFYLGLTYRMERLHHDTGAQVHEYDAEVAIEKPYPMWLGAVTTVAGLAGVLIGAKLLVSGAVTMARTFEIPETVIGLTIVAIGTSMPELVTSAMAAIRKHGDVAIGNIIGSNIYNVLGILGATAVVQPIPVSAEILELDVWVLGATTALFLFFAFTGWRIDRREGGLLLAGYVAYLAVQVMRVV